MIIEVTSISAVKGSDGMEMSKAGFFSSARGWFSRTAFAVERGCVAAMGRARLALLNSRGASHFIELLIGVLIVVVVGALFLTQSRDKLKSFFDLLWTNIQDMFNL